MTDDRELPAAFAAATARVRGGLRHFAAAHGVRHAYRAPLPFGEDANG